MGKKSRKGRKKALPGGIIPPGTAPGSKLTVPLPDGRNLTLTTPPGSKPGDCISLKEVDRAKNGHPSIALASGRDVGAARDRADALQKLTDIRAASSQADVAASRSAVAGPPAGIPPPGRASSVRETLPTPPASSPKPLTDDELRALAKSIQGLPPDKLVHVEPILKEIIGHVGDGEFAVHLDALDPGTLRRLQRCSHPLLLGSIHAADR